MPNQVISIFFFYQQQTQRTSSLMIVFTSCCFYGRWEQISFGFSVQLTCQILPNRPPPHLKWIIAASLSQSQSFSHKNTLSPSEWSFCQSNSPNKSSTATCTNTIHSLLPAAIPFHPPQSSQSPTRKPRNSSKLKGNIYDQNCNPFL